MIFFYSQLDENVSRVTSLFIMSDQFWGESPLQYLQLCQNYRNFKN
jgi:hypothetical protein